MRSLLIICLLLFTGIVGCTPPSATDAVEQTSLTAMNDSAQQVSYHSDFTTFTSQGDMLSYLTQNANTLTVLQQTDSMDYYTVLFNNDATTYYVLVYNATGAVSISSSPPNNWTTMTNSPPVQTNN
jgi:hypothetical protein